MTLNTGHEKESGGRSNSRLPRGQRTPETEFVKPILQILRKMGGSGEADAVVERVGRTMKPVLQDVDYEPLASDGNPRWHKTAHWARYRMVQQGFLEPYSRRGIWEISEKGRAHLGPDSLHRVQPLAGREHRQAAPGGIPSARSEAEAILQVLTGPVSPSPAGADPAPSPPGG